MFVYSAVAKLDMKDAAMCVVMANREDRGVRLNPSSINRKIGRKNAGFYCAHAVTFPEMSMS